MSTRSLSAGALLTAIAAVVGGVYAATTLWATANASYEVWGALIAVPIIIQSYGIFALGYGWAYLWAVPHRVAAPCALIGTSNFFELAVAVAIGLFGLNSGAALATVVGVLVEVPVMLSLVAIANRTRERFPE